MTTQRLQLYFTEATKHIEFIEESLDVLHKDFNRTIEKEALQGIQI